MVPICTSQMATTHAPVSGRAHARFLLGSRSHGVSGAFIPPLTIVQQLKQCLAARALVRKTKRIETRPHSSTVFLLCTSSEKCQTGRAWGSSEAWQPASDHQPVLHVQLLASCFTALLEMVPPPPHESLFVLHVPSSSLGSSMLLLVIRSAAKQHQASNKRG